MKGLIYGDFTLNKKWFIIAGVFAAISAAVGAVLINVMGGDPEGVNLINNLMLLFEIVPIVLCLEWLGRNLEANLKNRFANYALSAVSHNTFTLAMLMDNILTTVAGLAMSLAVRGIMSAFDSSYWTTDHVKLMCGIALFMGAFEFILVPLVIKLKSAEKAGMIVGLTAGFGVIFPIMLVFEAKNGNLSALLPKICEIVAKDWFIPAFIGGCAAVYALAYVLLITRIKKGDVC